MNKFNLIRPKMGEVVKIEDKYRIPIGKWVVVRGIYKFSYRIKEGSTQFYSGQYDRCYHIEETEPFLAKVVGIARHSLGRKELVGPEEGWNFTTRGYVEAWKVIRGLTNKTISVPDHYAHIRRATSKEVIEAAASGILPTYNDFPVVPIQYGKRTNWTPAMRRELSKDVEHQPRDKAGKFIG